MIMEMKTGMPFAACLFFIHILLLRIVRLVQNNRQED